MYCFDESGLFVEWVEDSGENLFWERAKQRASQIESIEIAEIRARLAE